MEFPIELNGKKMTVHFENNKKLKRCYLKIVDSATLNIKAHSYFTLEDAKKLIYEKSSWIKKHTDNFKKSCLKEDEFYFLGNISPLIDFDIQKDGIDEFYKQKAKEIIPNIVKKYSEEMQLFPKEVKFRKNRSRWGSCSFNNVINFNTNLMKLPFSAIDYVVIHELAHIKHKNHSKDFWNLVETFCPNYKEEEKVIKYF